jgi:hypothetical protein
MLAASQLAAVLRCPAGWTLHVVPESAAAASICCVVMAGPVAAAGPVGPAKACHSHACMVMFIDSVGCTSSQTSGTSVEGCPALAPHMPSLTAGNCGNACPVFLHAPFLGYVQTVLVPSICVQVLTCHAAGQTTPETPFGRKD